MNSPWRCLEEVRGLSAVPAEWRRHAGSHFDAFKAGFLQKAGRNARSVPCSNTIGCTHEVHLSGAGFVGVCKDDDGPGCDDIPLTADDVAVWALNFARLGRAVAKAFGCDARDAAFGLGQTRQVACLGSPPLPIILTIQQDEDGFGQVVAQLAARLPEGFILLVPSNRFCNAGATESLARVNAGFFDLETYLTLLPSGVLHAKTSGGVLFSPFLPDRKDGVTDSEAKRVFDLMQRLDAGQRKTKAPRSKVFRLFVIEKWTRSEIARDCRCQPSLISAKFREIEGIVKSKMPKLQALASRLAEMESATPAADAHESGRESQNDATEEDGDEE